MKKRYVAVMLLCMVCMAAGAEELVSYFGIGAGVYSQLHFDNSNITDSKLGGGGEVTLAYHSQRGNFIFMAGLSGAFASTRIGVKTGNDILVRPATDSRGRDYQMVVDMKDREDRCRMFDLRLPVLLGVELDPWYLLAGPVLVMNLKSNTYHTAMVRTKGRYDEYYEDLVNLPQHGFHDFERMSYKGSMRFTYDARLAIETGYTFYFGKYKLSNRASSDSKLRLGLFAECSVINIRSNNTRMLVSGSVLDENGKLNLVMNHAYTAEATSGNWVRTALVGVRLTYLIRVKRRPGLYCPCMNK